jgi:hypothetical protein
VADREFFQNVAASAAQVINCEKCQEQLQKRNKGDIDLGLTQPGWVGPEYTPGDGVVVVLQNPGVGGIKRQGKEGKYQAALRALSDNPTADEYLQFVETVLQMVPGWPMWNRHVSSLVDGCLSPRQIAWLNAVKFRTPCDDGLRTDEKRHSRERHLSGEIAMLKPAVVVTIGAVAQETIGSIKASASTVFQHQHIKMRGTESSEAYAHTIRDQIRNWGYCRI